MFNLVADRSYYLKGLVGGIGKHPFFVALSGPDRAGVAASHGHDDIKRIEHFPSPSLGLLASDVDALIGHGSDGSGVYLAGRFRTTRVDGCSATGEVLELLPLRSATVDLRALTGLVGKNSIDRGATDAQGVSD
jgi:hypothetical protein